MTIKAVVASIASLLLSITWVQAGPRLLSQHGAWGVYSYRSDTTWCYVLSVPVSELPADVDHGENFVMISRAPKDDQPEAVMGYRLKPGSDIDVVIADEHFSMFTQDNKAWLASAEEDRSMVNAMRAASKMKLLATSWRGTQTQYAYSLMGLTAALKASKICKSAR
ncbi:MULTISPECIES: invasion associated locus B family protein [unclassified Mesorhizobium]|uniref:invasion associated locus B family protein n=1 Tax=unclassified Mesorhizobium TaxID=325217 RepID=UPI001AED11F4|nr:invasion associated locus B family protein [Mesorhizobium sp. WSM1497]